MNSKYIVPKGVQAKPRLMPPKVDPNTQIMSPQMASNRSAQKGMYASWSNNIAGGNSISNLKHKIKTNMKKMKNKNWIKGAIKHPGALHAEMGVPQGKKISAKKLASAAKKGGKLGMRARLAETLKKFHKGKKMNKVMCKKHKKMNCSIC